MKTKSQYLVYTHKKSGLDKKPYFTTKRQQKRIQIFGSARQKKSNKICDTPLFRTNSFWKPLLEHRRIPSRKLSAVWDENCFHLKIEDTYIYVDFWKLNFSKKSEALVEVYRASRATPTLAVPGSFIGYCANPSLPGQRRVSSHQHFVRIV